jgi:signal transduction histidine kinase
VTVRSALGTRYAAYVAALVLGAVSTALLGAGFFAFRQSRVLQQEIHAAVDSARSKDEEAALRGTAGYLGSRLFNPLYRLDIERLNEEIVETRRWLPVKSFLVAGTDGRVVADGTDANSRYGEALPSRLPPVGSTEVLLFRRGQETELHFSVRSGGTVAGSAVVTLAEAPWHASLRQLQDRTGALWASHRMSLLLLGVFALAITLALGIATSVWLSRTLARPLTDMSRAARRIAAGDFDQRVEVGSDGELKDLAEALTAMARALRAHEEALRRERADLAAKNEELLRFTYTVSHDLKGPLVTIRSYVGQLEQSQERGERERFRADIVRVLAATDKMRRLLDDLLELSRVGRVMNPPSDVPLGELAHEAAELLKGRLTPAGVRVEIAPELPVVRGDRARLLEVLQNLIDNAAKFMGAQPQPRIEIGVRREPARPVFFVRDNGVGIATAHHERVFGLFEKLDPRGEGTGLGLALVRRIVEAHGGRVWVESEGEGRGATFCFTL